MKPNKNIYFLYIIVGAIILFCFCKTLLHYFNVLYYPAEVADGEGLLSRNILYLAQHKAIYQNINQWPFVFNVYPIFLPFLGSIFISLIKNPLLIGRIISVFSTFLIAILIYKYLRLQNTDKKIAIISSFAFLISPFVFIWGAWLRPDILAILFSFLSIYYFSKAKKFSIFLSGLFAILAFFTKPTMIAAPVAIFLYLLIAKKYRELIIWSAIVLFFGITIFYLINYQTHSQYFLHVIRYNILSYNFRAFISYSGEFIILHWFFVFCFVYFLALSLKEKKHLLPLLYGLVVVLLTLTSGRAGASINYYLELVLVVILASGLLLNHFNINNKKLMPFVLLLLILQICWFGFYKQIIGQNIFNETKEYSYSPSKQDFNTQIEIKNFVEQFCPGKIFSEDAVIALSAQKEPVAIPATGLIALQKANLWNQENFVNLIQQKEFSCIILSKGWIAEKSLRAIQDNYTLLDTKEALWQNKIYKPK